MQLHCAATMDRTSAIYCLVPKDQQNVYALRALGLEDGSPDNVLVDPLPEGWHPETHNRNADSSKLGHIPLTVCWITASSRRRAAGCCTRQLVAPVFKECSKAKQLKLFSAV